MSDATSEDLPSEREFARRAGPGTFSHDHLLRVAERLVTRFPDIVSAAGAAEDASGIEVTLLPDAAVNDDTRRRSVERLHSFMSAASIPVPLNVTGVSGPFEYPEGGLGPIEPGRPSSR